MNNEYIMILVTTKDKAQAKKMANALLDGKLIACANIVEHVHSLFVWQGKKDSAEECMLILKSKKNLFNKIVKTVKLLHSYEVPEIIALPIILGEKKYLSWIKRSVC